MALHAAAMMAFFVDQLPQAQCVLPPNADTGLKQWIQPILNLVSIVAVVGIAIWSLGATSRKEHRRWVLDQKKAEWSALLHAVANVFHITNFTTSIGWNREIADRITTELGQALEKISIACANCIFLDNFSQNKEGDKKINEFLKNTKLQAQKLKGNLGLFDYIIDRSCKAGSAADIDSKSLERNMEVVSDQISDLAKQSRTLLDWLQNEAALDLGVTAKGEEH
jgi:hypothetical protein